jgi:single-strand DNA-binding protein
MDLKFPKLNSLTISGRLTRDSELKYTPNGAAVLQCGLAIDDGYWDKNAKQWVDQTIFMDVKVWGPQAERLSNTLKKGSPVIVEGRLKQHTYTTQDGQNRKITDIHVDRIQSLETTNRTDNNSYDDNNNSNQQSNQSQNNNEKAQTKRPEPDFVNDDVPF